MPTRNNSSVRERIWRYYFTSHYVSGESPILTLSLAFPAVFVCLAFLTMGFESVWPIFFALAIGLFALFIILHFVLWIAGSFYWRGVLGSLKLAALFTGCLLVLGAVGGFLLYGWFIPLAVILAAFGSVPEPVASVLLPFLIIFILTVVGAWYAKGLSYLEGL